MADRELAADIEDAAVTWAAKVERGLDQTEQAELDRWLDGDTRRLGAFVRAQAAWIHAERAGAMGTMPQGIVTCEDAPREITAPQPSVLTRRRLLAGGGVAIAASLGGAFLIGHTHVRTLESGLGEIRRLALADGSTITLDTDTKVEVIEGSGDRKLALRQGKLFLDVLNDKAAPLAIEAGGLLLEMAEGAFSVQAVEQLPLVALVTSGKLRVSQGGGFLGKPQERVVDAGREFSLEGGATLAHAAVRPIATAQREQALAWRDGMLSFGGEALGTAVRAFDRYGRWRIVISSPELARQQITGLFKADDPVGFAHAVAASFGGDVSTQGNVIRISAG